jgi:hypothetical protein
LAECGDPNGRDLLGGEALTTPAAAPWVNTLVRLSPKHRIWTFAQRNPEQGVWLGVALTSLGLLLALAAALVSTGQLRAGWQRLPIGEGLIHEIGFAYQAPLGTDRLTSHLHPSAAVILENGRELGPGNAQHGDIRTSGAGRFSFWGDWVYLSASDNSDPRVNGRVYVAYGPGPATPYVAPLAGVLAALATICGVWLCASAAATRWPSDRSMTAIASDVFRNRNPVLLPLFTIVVLVGGIAIVANTIFLLAEPVEWLTVAHRRLLQGTTLALIGIAGAVIGRSIRVREFFRPFCWCVLLGLLTALVIWQPESAASFDSSFFRTPAAVGIALVGVLVGYLRAVAPQAAAFASRRYVPIAVVCSVLVALPGTLSPVVQWWNISGFMDSHMYDMDAHGIASGTSIGGNSFVMPFYQYGMAALYFIFGHFFFVQQVANVFWLCLFVALLTLAAYELFRDVRAAAIMGIIAALITQFRLFVKITQIENWYLPLVAAILYAWTRYRAVPTMRRAIWLAAAIGLAFNCRSQGAFFFAVMCLAPIIHRELGWKTRLTHTVVIGAVVGASLIPWSARNYVYEGRFDPSSDQASIGLLFNDHRVGFYGIRWDLYSWQRVLEEYEARFPDKNERFAAIRRDAIANTIGSPLWWSRAFAWRTLSFYGLLPPGVWGANGVEPTDWAKEWRAYVYNGVTPLILITLSLLGLIRRPTRDAWFLAAAIFANLAVMLVASQREARISFPVFPIHVLLGLALVLPFAPMRSVESDGPIRRRVPAMRYALIVITAILVLCAVVRIAVGRANRYAPLLEPSLRQSASAVAEHRVLNGDYRDVDVTTIGGGMAPPAPNERVRVRLRLTNYMLPPKSAGRVDYLPSYVSDPEREQFFYARTEDGQHYLGVTYFGAVTLSDLRENDLVVVEGRVLEGPPVPLIKLLFWLHADAVFKAGEFSSATAGSPQP